MIKISGAKNPKIKNYNKIKINFRNLIFYFKYYFYYLFGLLIVLKKKKEKKKVIGFNSFKDARFINFFFDSLKKNYQFAILIDENFPLCVKKIGLISFIKNFIQQKQNEVDLSIKYDATHNNLKLNEVNFDTNYFKYFHIKKIDKNKIFLPYYCYPKSKKDDFPKKIKKSIPIVFSGSVNINWYDKFYWKHYNGKRMLSRNEILNYIVDNFRESVFFAKSFKSIQYADDKKIILFLNKNMKSKQKSILKNFEHLRIISMANFFLTAPGTEMPLCHHLIESIKLKTIPITNYGHYLNPKLSKKNSIDFQSFEQLDFAIKKAIKLKSKDIVNMQASLTSYYNNYLSEDSFLRRFNSIKTPFSIISNNDHDSVRLFKKNFSKLF